MKYILITVALVAFGLSAPVFAEAGSEKDTTTIIRHATSVGLGEEGATLSIVPAEDGQFSWSLTWQSDSVVLTKGAYLKGEAWFAFVESPSRVWFFNGIDELMIVERRKMERRKTDFTQQYAFYKNATYPLLDSCPPEVVEGLPKRIKTWLSKKQNG